MKKFLLGSLSIVASIVLFTAFHTDSQTKAYADVSALPADLVANRSDLMSIANSTGTQLSGINWETMVRSTVGAVNWSAIVLTTNSVNWNTVILPTSP